MNRLNVLLTYANEQNVDKPDKCGTDANEWWEKQQQQCQPTKLIKHLKKMQRNRIEFVNLRRIS